MNNDLISREALREDFYELEIHGTMAVKAVLPIIEERIDNLPAVDAVEVVHAKWVYPTMFGYRAFHIPHCSACEGVPCGVDQNTKFCPNCGARMDGE